MFPRTRRVTQRTTKHTPKHPPHTPETKTPTKQVSRSLAACEGALLVVDASQGVEAQTLANVWLAIENDLEIIPVLNKIDLPGAEPERVIEEIESIIGLDCSNILKVSAKVGIGIEETLEAIVARVPPPRNTAADALRALIFDSYYDPYRGVVCQFRVVDGSVAKGDTVVMMNTGKEFTLDEIGVLAPSKVPVSSFFFEWAATQSERGGGGGATESWGAEALASERARAHTGKTPRAQNKKRATNTEYIRMNPIQKNNTNGTNDRSTRSTRARSATSPRRSSRCRTRASATRSRSRRRRRRRRWTATRMCSRWSTAGCSRRTRTTTRLAVIAFCCGDWDWEWMACVVVIGVGVERMSAHTRAAGGPKDTAATQGTTTSNTPYNTHQPTP